MGHLDDKTYQESIAECAKCDAKAFEVNSYVDRELTVMLATPNHDGRWTHDPATLIDGTYRIRCIGCSTDSFTTEDCPRCNRTGGLADAITVRARLPVPQRCPSCRGTELILRAVVPARVRTGDRPTAPTAIAGFGDPGFHIARIECGGCDWTSATEGCPLCAGPATQRT